MKAFYRVMASTLVYEVWAYGGLSGKAIQRLDSMIPHDGLEQSKLYDAVTDDVTELETARPDEVNQALKDRIYKALDYYLKDFEEC